MTEPEAQLQTNNSSDADLQDALRTIDPYRVIEEWDSACRREYALRDGPPVEIDTSLPPLLILAAEVTRDVNEPPERALIDGLTSFEASRPSAGVAIRQLACLGYSILRSLIGLGLPSEVVAIASARASLVVDQALVIIATGSLQSLSHEAIRDSLTGLFNRRAWDRDFEKTLKNSRSAGSIFSIVTIDLDGLKRVNDVEGHAAGDELIRRMAATLEASARPDDTVYRWGGDEFGAIMPECNGVTALGILDQIAVEFPRFSYGIATFPDDGDNQATLEELADGRMYEMKETKRAALGPDGDDAAPGPDGDDMASDS